MSKKLLLGIVIALVIIGAVYYMGGSQSAVDGALDGSGQSVSQTEMSQDEGSQMQGTPPAPGQAQPRAGTGANVDAEVSALISDGQSESAQATSENGTESAAQLNSSMDSQSIYAE
ncbi:MAG TPA: hypothetical protein VJK53_05760 [Candidatus Paceibacterota bacterium]